MFNISDLNYHGTIYHKGYKMHYRKAEERDVFQIAELYRSIAIHYHNYREKLNPQSPHSFEHTGGMFILMDEDEIRRELHNPHSFWALLLDEQEQVVASFWVADHNDLLPSFNRVVKENILYPRELIVSPHWKNKNMGKLICYMIFCRAQQLGYCYSICDVYKVVAYAVDGVKWEVDLLNKPSYYNLLHIGGKSIGTIPIKKVILKNLHVWVESQVILFEHKTTSKFWEKIVRRGE